MREPEAVTSFLLPDCHHGEFAMRVLAFLCRISLFISHSSGTTRVVCVANTPIRIFMKCLKRQFGFIYSFNDMSVKCRLLPALQRGRSGREGRELNGEQIHFTYFVPKHRLKSCVLDFVHLKCF